MTDDFCDAWQLVTLLALAGDVPNASNPIIEAAPIVVEIERVLFISSLLEFTATEGQH